MTSVLDPGAEMVTMQCNIRPWCRILQCKCSMQCNTQCNTIAVQIVLQNANVISNVILHCTVERLAETSILDPCANYCNMTQLKTKCKIQYNTA